MCKSTVMKQAHAMCRATIKAGDNYHVTLGACIRAIHAKPSTFDRVKSAVVSIDFGAVVMALWATFMSLLFITVIAATVQHNNDRAESRAYDTRMAAIDTAIQARDDHEFAQILRKANALQAAHLATYN